MKKGKLTGSVSLVLAMAMAFGACAKVEPGTFKQSKIEVKSTEDDPEPTDDPVYTEPVETTTDETEPVEIDDSKVISLWSYTNELPSIAEEYLEQHPDCEYTFNVTIVATDGGAYQSALDNCMAAGYGYAPDIYCVESAFGNKYISGDMSEYAGTYKDLGIDVDQLIADAEITPYSVEYGTRASDGEVVGLSYQSTSSVMFYRASIAEETFGTSDPDEIGKIFGTGTNSWDSLLIASEELYNNGYAVVTGMEDLWRPLSGSVPEFWDIDGELNLADDRIDFIDTARILSDNLYTNNTTMWTYDWYDSMGDAYEEGRPVFAYFGPMWFANYLLKLNAGSTYGDWRVCEAPFNYFWGGAWIMTSKFTANCSDEKKAAIADFLTWVTLDTSETGFQYQLATSTMDGYFEDWQDVVPSNVVMKEVDGSIDLFGGQNIYEVFAAVNGKTHLNGYDDYNEVIEIYWIIAINDYLSGIYTRAETIDHFQYNVQEVTGLYIG